RELADPESARRSDDAVIVHLADGTDAVVAERRRRLVQALSDFDAATIATTHSFCQQMLDGLGFAGEREPEATFVESIGDLITEVVDDLYIARYAGFAREGGARPPISRSEAAAVAADAVGDRQATLVPENAGDSVAGHRVRFAEAARAEVERRKRAMGIRDYDDLLSLLHDVLADPVHGPGACARVRDRYRVVLVDEFQDTDPLQWAILRRAFHGTATMVLVGDPKQAIYAFRGAEVLSYLDAVTFADNHLELTCNWRSDGRLIDALHHLYGDAALGNEQIVVQRIQSALAPSRMSNATPLRLRHLPRAGAGPINEHNGFPPIAGLRSRVTDDVAADIVRLLDSRVELTVHGRARPVCPGDIAVLVPTGARADEIRAALDRAGVTSVLASGTSIFSTPSAGHWLRVLEGLEQPHRADRVRRAALTPLLGWTAADLDRRGDDLVAEVSAQLRDLADLFGQAGFAAAFEQLSTRTELEARLLAIEAGERELTDLRHLAQLLNRTAVERSVGVTALTRWLADRIARPAIESSADRIRRLDSDAEAVQIATVHSSKGLQYPIVYLPFGWDPGKPPDQPTLLLHDPEGRRVLDVGGKSGRGHAERRRRHDEEESGEGLRLLYVALTRAMCQVVVWWAPANSTAKSPLHRMIFGRPSNAVGIPGPAAVPPDAEVEARLLGWAAGVPDLVAVEAVGSGEIPFHRWTPATQRERSLGAARFDRILDAAWRRTSYSALTATVHEPPGVGREAEEPVKDDEPEDVPLIDDADGTNAAAELPSPMNAMPFGAAFGTLVHAVLEAVDPTADDLAAELSARCREALSARLAEIDADGLAATLLPVMHTKFDWGAGTSGSLADIAPHDRLAELEFEIPLAGGDSPRPEAATVREIAELLRAHLPADDPMSDYADRLAALDAVPLRGYLTGSIDAVLRVPGPRFVVVDYKTNRLGTGDLTVSHYSAGRMAEEMLRAHYPLQALIYLVALHRYLRWRLPEYRPERHLGGARYLFVRGMAGPQTPPGHGVFEWDVPPAQVNAPSDVLAGS
ncbi:MAG: UvrD-helicase domain-containing protein, partial [Aldersonia sp.]|nr:UvrD-helicase domain-containing protein [Aldersonia sp.]